MRFYYNKSIKKYQIIITIAGAWVFPLTYIAFWMGMPAESTFIIYFAVYFMLVILRAYLAIEIINLNIWRYLKDVVLKTIYITIVAFVPVFAITYFFKENILRTIIAGPIIVISTAIISYSIGLDKEEKDFVNRKIKALLKKSQI